MTINGSAYPVSAPRHDPPRRDVENITRDASPAEPPATRSAKAPTLKPAGHANRASPHLTSRVPVLAGYTIAVMSERRRHPLAAMLEAAGAKTTSVQSVQSVSPADDDALLAQSQLCAEGPIAELLVTSSFGFRAWIRSARRGHVDEAFVTRIRGARLLASNPRAADSLRELGLTEISSTESSSTEDLFRYLMAQDLRGQRVVVQSDDVAHTDLCVALRVATGADVIEVPTYRCLRPAYPGHIRRLCEQIIARQVDAVVSVGAPSMQGLLDQASDDGRLDDVLNPLAGDVPTLCLGDASAAPLSRRRVAAHRPTRPYLDELVGLVEAIVPARGLRVSSGRRRIEIRGRAVVLDGEFIPIQPGPIAVLRALARAPGRIMSFAEIRRSAGNWGAVDDHAIEMAVSRLRVSLRSPEMIQTVLWRGYRLLP